MRRYFLGTGTNGDIVFYDLKNIRELNLEYKGGPVVSDPNLKGTASCNGN